ncbi:MAG: zinc-ribbon domain-containing protein [Bacilli bacterium]|nr:zinc-ribbon domain-containing protein [Bacilli bacterium]
MKCPNCQEENRSGSRYCSNCGRKLPQNDANQAPTSKGKQIASKILSICSIPFGVLTGGLGLAMGIVAKALDREKAYDKLSTLGIIFGSITLTLIIAGIIVLMILSILYFPEIVQRFVDAITRVPKQ